MAAPPLRNVRQDARWLRELLAEGRPPEAWIAPEHVRQWRSRLHLRKALIDERTQWLLRIRSVLYHHGLSAGAPDRIARSAGRDFLKRRDLPADARERVEVALGMVDTLERQIHQIEHGLRRIARHQRGCQALMGQFGVGELIALTVLSELGDVTRLSSSRKAVRFARLDSHAAATTSCTPSDPTPSRPPPNKRSLLLRLGLTHDQRCRPFRPAPPASVTPTPWRS